MRGRVKPSGTADALFQALFQFKELRSKDFCVCNSDNLYSVSAFEKTVVKEWWSYWNNHTDEIRSVDWDNNWIGKENLDLDIPYVFVVGSYNSNAGNQELIDAYLEWNVKPGVENGVMLYGGATV